MNTKQKFIALLVTTLILLVSVFIPFLCYLLGRFVCGMDTDWLTCFGVGFFFATTVPTAIFIIGLLFVLTYYKVSNWLFDRTP